METINTLMDSLGFKITFKPRELTEEEVDKFKLRYYEGNKMKPVFESTDNVWSAADTGNLPTYRIYNGGTNNMIVLKYTPNGDIWEKINLFDIGNLNSFIWKMCLKLNN